MPNLSSKLSSWRCFVDDSICFVKKDSIKFVLDTLNNFHKNIKFISEEEINGKFPFLNTLLARNNHYIDTIVYRTKTNTHIYLNWNSFGPNSWKWGTLRTIVTRGFEICSTDTFLEEEIEYIRAVFYHQNNYPLWLIDKIINEVKEKPKVTKVDNVESCDKKHRLVLPYKGDRGNHILRSMKKYVRKLLPKKSTLRITYTGKKISSQFNIKEKTNFEHQHDLIYHVNCPLPTCEENYIGETARHIHECIKDHNGRDHKSHMLKHSIEKHLDNMTEESFKITAKNFKITKWKRKISESFWIRDLRPSLNAQDKSVPLNLFNWLQ